VTIKLLEVGLPNSPFFYDMQHFPAAFLHTSPDEPAVATPGQALGAEESASTPGCQSLQKFQAPQIVMGLGISLIASLPVSSQFLSQKKVAQALFTSTSSYSRVLCFLRVE
jgi:hypothetical protein